MLEIKKIVTRKLLEDFGNWKVLNRLERECNLQQSLSARVITCILKHVCESNSGMNVIEAVNYFLLKLKVSSLGETHTCLEFGIGSDSHSSCLIPLLGNTVH